MPRTFLDTVHDHSGFVHGNSAFNSFKGLPASAAFLRGGEIPCFQILDLLSRTRKSSKRFTFFRFLHQNSTCIYILPLTPYVSRAPTVSFAFFFLCLNNVW